MELDPIYTKLLTLDQLIRYSYLDPLLEEMVLDYGSDQYELGLEYGYEKGYEEAIK
jgi:hypothetical protein